MRLFKELYLIIFLCLSMLSACMPTPTDSPLISPLPPITAYRTEDDLLSLIPPPPVPESGKASISGLLYSFTGNGPIPGTVYYLTLAGEEGEPPNILVGPKEKDIRGVSDEHGRVVLNNIPPGSYYLVVWAPYNWILAVESEAEIQPRLIVLEPDQQLILGLIYLPWP